MMIILWFGWWDSANEGTLWRWIVATQGLESVPSRIRTRINLQRGMPFHTSGPSSRPAKRPFLPFDHCGIKLLAMDYGWHGSNKAGSTWRLRNDWMPLTIATPSRRAMFKLRIN